MSSQTFIRLPVGRFEDGVWRGLDEMLLRAQDILRVTGHRDGGSCIRVAEGEMHTELHTPLPVKELHRRIWLVTVCDARYDYCDYCDGEEEGSA